MRATLLFLSALLLAGAAAAYKTYDGYKVYRVIPNEAQVKILSALDDKKGFDIWSKVRKAGKPVDIMVAPSRTRFFESVMKASRIKYEVLINNYGPVLKNERMKIHHTSVKRSAPSGKITFDQYYSYDEIVAYVQGLATQYPDLMTVTFPGTTSEGRNIPLVTISTGGGGSRPAILIDAGIHAREWIAPATALYIINQLVENAAANADLTASVDWLIIPVLNPDGYEYSRTDDRFWRKNRSPAPGSSCLGTDPNRNFDYHWAESGVSSNPCSEIFAGSTGFSELESRTLRDVNQANSGRIKLYLALHSYGPYLLYPWSYDYVLPDNWQELDDLAASVNSAITRAGGEYFEYGNSVALLGATAGSSDDWNMSAGVPLAYTVELPGGGSYGFDLPASEIESVVTTTFEGIKVYGQYVASNKK